MSGRASKPRTADTFKRVGYDRILFIICLNNVVFCNFAFGKPLFLSNVYYNTAQKFSKIICINLFTRDYLTTKHRAAQGLPLTIEVRISDRTIQEAAIITMPITAQVIIAASWIVLSLILTSIV